jgi:hypothetical protein
MATSFRPHIPTATDENARIHCRRRPLAVRPEGANYQWRTFPPGDLWTGRALQEECFEWTIRSASRRAAAPPLCQQAAHQGRGAQADADDRVERSLYSRAVGYSCDAEKIRCDKNGKVTRVQYVEHVSPDVTAFAFAFQPRAVFAVWQEGLTLSEAMWEACECGARRIRLARGTESPGTLAVGLSMDPQGLWRLRTPA